jgi:hypothetical protein
MATNRNRHLNDMAASANSQTGHPRFTSRIPLWVKLAFTAFVAVLAPYYLHCYGPTNFLYFCDVALLMALVAVWSERSIWASMPAVGILVPQAVWMVDFLGSLVGLRVVGMTAYMFDPGIPLFTRGLSFFHFWLPLFLLWLLVRLGYDRRAFVGWTLLAGILILVCFFLMPEQPAPADNPNLPVNINYVRGFSDTEPQHWMPPLAYLGLLMVALPTCVFLPTHLILSRVFRKSDSGSKDQIRSTDFFLLVVPIWVFVGCGGKDDTISKAEKKDADKPGLAEIKSIAEEGFIYGLPIVMNYAVMYDYCVDKDSGQYKGPFNQVHNEARVFTYKDTAIITPNSDTPYSLLWADLRTEPLVLSVPAVDKARYYSAMLCDGNTFNYGYIGSRATGNEAGDYLVVGPDWKGETPAGVKKVFHATTQFSLIAYLHHQNTQVLSRSGAVFPIRRLVCPSPLPRIQWQRCCE